ncbi:PREDICTED: uncharacterized protein LOC109335446 [Lupinus angustifolius]|uniref:uncharacterized protein LOC109335446 n=1 Tax=Lupinus angustifolius TaxID=3871 RepID=UPI00092FC709|nr:PREDICTED: uncharacterized protein LOC109335446 [Lupinus angustifolius]
MQELKDTLKHEFEMTDLGKHAYFLGIEFTETSSGVVMHQRKYIEEVLNKFKMSQCNEAITPVEGNLRLDNCECEELVDNTLFKQLVGCLRFICHSKPKISYGVGLVSRFMKNPKHSHLAAAKRILRYRKGTINDGIIFPYQKAKGEMSLAAYSDSD